MLPDVYEKVVPMLDKCTAAADAASETPVFLDQCMNPVVIQSSTWSRSLHNVFNLFFKSFN